MDNNKDNIKIELNELVNQGLIISYTISPIEISILSLERMEISIETDFISYYKLISIKIEEERKCYNEYFECFEQLLCKFSGKYNERFNNLLIEKLNSINKNEINN